MKKRIIFLLLIATTPLFGQIIGRKVLAAGGSTDAFNNNLFISSTIGEPIAGTVTDGNKIFNQGFQQSDLTIRVATQEVPQEQVSAKVFPNPAKDEMVVELDNVTTENVTLRLYNVSGQLLLSQKTEVKQGQPIRLDVNFFSNGLYLLRITQNGKRDFTKQVVIQK